MAFTNELIHRQTTRIESLLANGRAWQAWQMLDRLVAIGSQRMIHGRLPREQLDMVANQIRQHVRALEQPLSAGADDEQRIERAQHSIALEQRSQAQTILLDLAQRRPDAALLLAGIYDVDGKPEACREACQQALKLLEDRGEERSDINQLREDAYGRLAQALRKAERYREAEQVLLSGLERWTASQPYFHFQLGYHYHQGGRPRSALEHYEQAAILDARFVEASQQSIRRLKLDTPACILRQTRPVTR